MSNRLRRHEATIEVDPVHLRVGGQDIERSAVRRDDCRIIAGADDDPRGHRHTRLDAGDERTFADVSNRKCVHSGSARTDAERGTLKKPRFAVWGGRMNLRKQVEPLLLVALQASSKQRHAQRATSQLTWD